MCWARFQLKGKTAAEGLEWWGVEGYLGWEGVAKVFGKCVSGDNGAECGRVIY